MLPGQTKKRPQRLTKFVAYSTESFNFLIIFDINIKPWPGGCHGNY